MSLASKCTCGKRGYYCDLSFDGCHHRVRQDIPFELMRFPGEKGSAIDTVMSDEEMLSAQMKIAFKNGKETPDKLLLDYWELVTTKPVAKHQQDYREWYKRLEDYINQLKKEE